jgi:hypothetical protein
MLLSIAMPARFQFITALLCEKVLQEGDGVTSAIRIVDVFQIPSDKLGEAIIQFCLVASLRTVPVKEQQLHVALFLVGPSGKRERIKELPEGPYPVVPFVGDPSVPGGLNLAIQLNIKPLKFGTGFIEIEVENEVVARVPFTVQPHQFPPQALLQH